MSDEHAPWARSVIAASLVVALSMGVLALLITGRWALAVLVLAAAIAISPAVYGALQRRRYPARTSRLSETARLPYPAADVWDLIKPAEKAPLLDPEVRRGYRIPGTPLGLGEQQAHARHDGWTIIIEVIEFEPGRRAMTEQVSPPPAERVRSVQSVEPVGDHCDYTMELEVDLAAGQRIEPSFDALWRSGVRDQIARINEVLGGGASPASLSPPPTP